MSACPHHAKVEAQFDDISDRLREKRDRILKLELEANHMKEQMDLIVRQGSEIKTSVDSLKQWQLYLMGGAAAALGIYGFVSQHWTAIVRILGGGA